MFCTVVSVSASRRAASDISVVSANCEKPAAKLFKSETFPDRVPNIKKATHRQYAVVSAFAIIGELPLSLIHI